MALRVLLLLASHTAASATLLPPRHVLNFRGVASDVESSGEDKSRLGLHFRGGAEDDESSGEDTDSTAPLTREQIVAKLNEVPTFTLIGEEQGGFVALKLADSEKNTICFFTDPEEAKTVLEMMQNAHTDKQLRLACVGLGTAYKLCGGWSDDTTKEAFASFDGSVQLRGTLGLIESTKPQIKEMMKAEGFEEAEWILPIFIVEELQGPTLVPMFLDPSVIRQAWEQAGRSKDNFPEKFVMMDIRMLVQKMEAPGMPWGRVHFVPSQGAATFANELIESAKQSAA